MAHAKQGVFIVEPFSCEVAIADYKHLKVSTEDDNELFIQEQLITSLLAVEKELLEHSECNVTGEK